MPESPSTARPSCLVLHGLGGGPYEMGPVIEALEAEGLRVRCAFALVDRLEGGREAVTQKGYGLSTLFTRSDFLP